VTYRHDANLLFDFSILELSGLVMSLGETTIAGILPNLNFLQRSVVSEVDILLIADANLINAIGDAALGTKTRSWPLLTSMTGDDLL
jgi:hypothetical protein